MAAMMIMMIVMGIEVMVLLPCLNKFFLIVSATVADIAVHVIFLAAFVVLVVIFAVAVVFC